MPFSPMMQHYLQIKEEYNDALIFYRLGDFYELFFDDALTASRELELTLTGRDCGMEERAPMCGVPFHAAETYIRRLVEKGYKVAVCEQMEDPRTAKGIVKREVIRVVTAGTLTDSESLVSDRNNYILCFYESGNGFGAAFADISTGKCLVTDVRDEKDLTDEIYKFMPSEIVCSVMSAESGIITEKMKADTGCYVSTVPDSWFENVNCRKVLEAQFGKGDAPSLGLSDHPSGYLAAGALFKYLFETQKSLIGQILSVTPYASGDYMIIDTVTRRNLELTETLRDKNRRGSLLWVIDKTKTAMGARKLYGFLLQPLKKKHLIEDRLDAVELFYDDPMRRDEIREYLDKIYDLERLLTRISNGNANPKDMLAFRNSLSVLPFIKQLLTDVNVKEINKIKDNIDPLTDVYDLINSSIDEDAPVSAHDTGIIKTGYDERIDHYRSAKSKGHEWLNELEAREREKTGIKMLRIKYNRVFGYTIEVTNSFKDQVPKEYRRIQTLSNAERFTTPELKNLEDEILGAEEKLLSLEYAVFCDIRQAAAKEIARVQKTADAVALLDAYCSLAYVAMKNRYVRPRINNSGVVKIEEGRHPVIEMMPGGEMFIPNDTCLDDGENRVLVITGPNMAGKSTYMRQSAAIALLAQMGSFVPAAKADICVFDRIFTRVGASDDLAAGQSTFMVEMTEVANILYNATKNSLVILDEIGRGTSTFDGLSIAWAVIEHIALKIKAKTLFATHYHELTELEGKLEGVKNYCIAVKEQGRDIIFLRKIVRGGADRSYGIQVARLAHVPEEVLKKASYLVKELVSADITEKVKDIAVGSSETGGGGFEQLSLFEESSNQEIINTLAAADLEKITPLEALVLLTELQNEIKGR